MGNSVNTMNRQPGYAGVNITCNVIDPTKLPADSPLLKGPICEGGNNSGPNSYPPTYYTNNYGTPPMGYPYPPYPVQKGSTKKKHVQAITYQYVKNLESYLNSPSEDLRKQAAKEVMQRFDEDKSRYNDAALNALVNKMLQDPASHNVKATALTILDSRLAQGNDTTTKILNNMAQNDKSRNGADAATASNILLKMSSPGQWVDTPINTQEQGQVSL